MKMIVGLGNVGREYAVTRHNAGFMVVQALGRRHQIRLDRQVGGRRTALAVHGEGRIGRWSVRLLLPQTMMNAAGSALRAVADWGLAPAQMLVVCDDVNLPFGTLRLRPGGSDGGHHGLASCLDALGTHAVPRLRIGVGRDPLPRDLTHFVLSPFSPAERPQAEAVVERGVRACEDWVTTGMQAAMNHTNRPEARER